MDETTYPPEAWQRVARAAKHRRNDLRLTQTELSARTGVSISVISKLEGARQPYYEPRILMRLEDGLGWARGSFEELLRGGEPTLTQSTSDIETSGTGSRFPESESTETDSPYPDDAGLSYIWAGREFLTPGEINAAIVGVQIERDRVQRARDQERRTGT